MNVQPNRLVGDVTQFIEPYCYEQNDCDSHDSDLLGSRHVGIIMCVSPQFPNLVLGVRE
jgi:hypothetical protein